MKKKLFAVLAAGTMLCGMLTAPVSAAETKYQTGDVNMNGAVDIEDAQLTLREYVMLVLTRHTEGVLTPEQRELALVIPQKYWEQEKYITDDNTSLLLCAQTILSYYTVGLADSSVRETDLSVWVEGLYQKT